MWGKNWPTPRPHVSGYFWIRNIFFPDTTTVNTHPSNSTAYPDVLNPLTRVGKHKSATNPATCERLNPDIFESDDVAKSCPVSYRTINQYGSRMCSPRANKANSPLCRALYGACLEDILVQRSSGCCSESGYHRMRVDVQIRFEYATCGRGIF